MARLNWVLLLTSGKHFRTAALTLAITSTLSSIHAQVRQPEIPGVIAPGMTLQLVRDGFVFTEGPVSAKDGTLYFSDLRTSLIYTLNQGGSFTIGVRETNGANGLAFAPNGDLLTAEGDGREISQILDGHLKVICNQGVDGSALMAPNSDRRSKRRSLFHRSRPSSSRSQKESLRLLSSTARPLADPH